MGLASGNSPAGSSTDLVPTFKLAALSLGRRAFISPVCARSSLSATRTEPILAPYSNSALPVGGSIRGYCIDS